MRFRIQGLELRRWGLQFRIQGVVIQGQGIPINTLGSQVGGYMMTLKKCAAVASRVRIQGSSTLVLLDSRLESNKEERKKVYVMVWGV